MIKAIQRIKNHQSGKFDWAFFSIEKLFYLVPCVDWNLKEQINIIDLIIIQLNLNK